jgi:hypothetical protein
MDSVPCIDRYPFLGSKSLLDSPVNDHLASLETGEHASGKSTLVNFLSSAASGSNDPPPPDLKPRDGQFDLALDYSYANVNDAADEGASQSSFLYSTGLLT